jgi:hypothetical protein
MAEEIQEMETIETEGYRAGSEYGLKTIIYKQLQKCIDEGSKEMTGGGTITRVIDGKPISIAVPNQREIYVNCCEHLRFLLLNHILEYKEKVEKIAGIKDYLKEMEKQVKEIDKEYNEAKNKLEKEFSELSYNKQYEYENLFSVNMQKISDNKEIKLVQLYKYDFMQVMPSLLAETNFFGEE